ncbi:MAG: hypothetical protein M5U12_05810 [Verrucomicrobia bacterium]|nr:hypothetical protein [Verrucomicrobiota bacterium]
MLILMEDQARHHLRSVSRPVRRAQPCGPPPNASPPGPTPFTRLPAEYTGVGLVHEFPATGRAELLQDQGACGGVGVGDFDDAGQPRLIEACFDGDRLVPRRSLPTLADAIPRPAARLPTVRAFANASLAKVLSPARLDAAQRFAVRQ